MNSTEDPSTNEQKHLTRISMLPLYERLLKITFHDTVSAIEHCRNVCGDFGFTVKQEASANRNIYVYCSREGLPDSQRNPKPTPQRKRPSKRCDCRWRIVLSENDQGLWEFRKSMNPNASEHNHAMMDPNDMVKAWPPEVNDMINYLAQQRLQTHEIRDAVKQRFSMIVWNERRFYNRLTEERKRIRQRNTADRARRLVLLSSQLAAVVAANEEWAHCVEGDLQRMFDNFCQLTRLGPESMPMLVDLQQQQQQQQQQSQQQNEADHLIHCTTQRLSIDTLPNSDMNDDADRSQQILSSPIKKRKTSGPLHQRTSPTPPPLPPSLLQNHPQQQKNAQCISFQASTSMSDHTHYELPPLMHHLKDEEPAAMSVVWKVLRIQARRRLLAAIIILSYHYHLPHPLAATQSQPTSASGAAAAAAAAAAMFSDFCPPPPAIKEERSLYDASVHAFGHNSNNSNTTATNNNHSHGNHASLPIGRPNGHPNGTSFISPEANVTAAAYY
ncbi:hypothetical protein BCR42DRAFT_494871 [Absidia repens]|uniref:FAR1 domain-containing protein n=1 Tax=Absidia repens TaxID=90262 RepID=A0A1X2I5T8_9FUNG|nr:hypothetical protein BCR42DRAFT_494871 [Absidia repens]